MLVRKGGFEPPRLSAPPPQDGVSASSTTSALRSNYGAIRCLRNTASRRLMVSRPVMSCNVGHCAFELAGLLPQPSNRYRADSAGFEQFAFDHDSGNAYTIENIFR